jgi:membrane-associated phospholipid phosphatase
MGNLHERPTKLIRSHRGRAKWKEYSYLLAPLAFSGALCLYLLYSATLLYSLPTLLFLLGVPIVGIAGVYKRAIRGWIALVMIVFSYEALAGPIDSLADSGKILSLFEVDKYLWGFNLTGWIQSSLSSTSMTDAAFVLYEMLVPLVAVTSLLIWRYRPSSFSKYVTAMLLASYAALVTFLLVPTAPPWFSGVADNLVRDSGLGTTTAYLGPLAAFFQPNYFASFPSMHAAYTVICSYFLLKTYQRLGAVSIIITGGILFSTLYLGQHYLVDILAGVFYALVPCILSERWQIVQ